MESNKINELNSSFVENLKKMIDVDTVIGTPYETNSGVIIVPITKVSFGFVSGGGEYGVDKNILRVCLYAEKLRRNMRY